MLFLYQNKIGVNMNEQQNIYRNQFKNSVFMKNVEQDCYGE